MTLDIASPGRYVFYLNFSTIGDGTGFAVAEQNFNFANLIEDASKYVLSVERFRVPTQAVPMLPVIVNAIRLVPKAAAVPVDFNLAVTFSLNQFLVQINTVRAGLAFSLNEDGRMLMSFNGFDDYTVQFAPKIAAIFDMADIVGLTLAGTALVLGASPVFDRLDDLHSLQIEAQTGLSGIQQEIITTEIFRSLVTDFLMPSASGMAYQGATGQPHNGAYTVNYDVRQDVQFNDAASRRFVMIKGNAPIQNITLEIAAIFRDGTRHRILLPPNSIMTIKLAFWKRHA